MDKALFLLLTKEAHKKPVRITTSELGRLIDMSQQNASRKISSLEKEGYIEKTSEGIKLTRKAYDEMSKEYAKLRQIFEGSEMEITGKLQKGIGEGQYYMTLPQYKKQIKEKLGFDPYPGTLNIRLDGEELWKRGHLLQLDPIVISGFKDRNRTYGDLFAYHCRLEGHNCAIIVPLRTHHPSGIIEIICDFDIRKKLKKKDGDMIKVVL